MNQPSRERIDTLFSDALERAPESRRRFLVDACGADRELFGEVDSLLRAHEASGGFLERIVPESADPERSTTPTLANGRVLWERFEIVRFLGQGGMDSPRRVKGEFCFRGNIVVQLLVGFREGS